MNDKKEKEIPAWGGLKKTRQREEVYRVLIQAKEPLSAQEIYQQIVRENGTDSFAVSTIYRALAAFEEKGLVVKSTLMGEDTAVYAWNQGTHKHYAICLECHKLVPLSVCPFEHMEMHTNEEDFQITGHKIELYGYCHACKTGRNKNK